MRRVFEVGHRLEEGRDVQCDVLRSRLREPTPTAEEKDREDVVCSLRHADDVRSHGVRPKARAALSDRLEYVQRTRGLRVRLSGWLLSSLERQAQPRETVRRSSVTPIGVAQQGREHGAMDMRVLSHVDRGEVPRDQRRENQRHLILRGIELRDRRLGGRVVLRIADNADRNLLDEAQHAVIAVDLDDLCVLRPVIEAMLRQRAEGAEARAERQHHIGFGDELHAGLRSLIAERSAPQRMPGGE